MSSRRNRHDSEALPRCPLRRWDVVETRGTFWDQETGWVFHMVLTTRNLGLSRNPTWTFYHGFDIPTSGCSFLVTELSCSRQAWVECWLGWEFGTPAVAKNIVVVSWFRSMTG